MYNAWVEAWNNFKISGTELFLCLLFLAVFVLLFAWSGYWVWSKNRRQRVLSILHLFRLACRKKGLAAEEVNTMRKHAKSVGHNLESALLESNIAFDKFISKVVDSGKTERGQEFNEFYAQMRHKLGFRPPARGLALNSTRELPAGQNLYVVLSEDLFLEGYIESIDEINLAVKLLAVVPAYINLTIGQAVQVFFNRSGDARYSGSCDIDSGYSDARGEHIILSHCTELRRDQRRQDFRVEEGRSVSVWVMDDALEQAADPMLIIADRVPIRARLDDISGGGASIIFHRNLQPNQGLMVNLDPAGVYGLPIVKAVVVRSSDRSRTDRWVLSVRFEDLRPSEHQRLINYIFQKERENLQIA
ncbi:hypothetical protein CEE37_09490 [candidate division LCP-89 bacterium B3_LCP]|uniref:PilZ domain-containing protein n=1 Tax=candidate division LCP-89 bacterium B3_LCP TaxID=2012998 RepID=A0A532UYG5_UNCL8|nr:MAG: hypothetical protein CEE37_09490 [candidate division LCP-89 bacterium B3_LCP]